VRCLWLLKRQREDVIVVEVPGFAENLFHPGVMPTPLDAKGAGAWVDMPSWRSTGRDTTNLSTPDLLAFALRETPSAPGRSSACALSAEEGDAALKTEAGSLTGAKKCPEHAQLLRRDPAA
jgi:hypothetical protein